MLARFVVTEELVRPPEDCVFIIIKHGTSNTLIERACNLYSYASFNVAYNPVKFFSKVNNLFF